MYQGILPSVTGFSPAIDDQGNPLLDGQGQPVAGKVDVISGLDKLEIEQRLKPKVDKAVVAAAIGRSMAAPAISPAPTTDAAAPSDPDGDSGATIDNNMGNLRAGPTSFQQFSTPAEGVAATANLLRSYPAKYGATTLTQIGAKWAPAGDGDNDPAAWAANVAPG